MIIKVNLKGKDRELMGDANQAGDRWHLLNWEDEMELHIFNGKTLTGWEMEQRLCKKKEAE